LILSKAILRTGGLEALRAQINAAQNQKCFGLKDLPLAVRWRRCSRQRFGCKLCLGESKAAGRQQAANILWRLALGFELRRVA